MPSPATVNVVRLHEAFAVEVEEHSFTDDATSVAPEPGASLPSGEIVWFVSYAPLDVSFVAEGAGGTIGVNVDVAV